MHFVKAHADGNDFLILEDDPTRRDHAHLAQTLCARHTGIGADGIEFFNPATNFLRLFNADGSEAELSGNGTRCVAAWLAHSQSLTELTLNTHGGPRPCRVVSSQAPTYIIESSMGVPRIMRRIIELPGLPPIEGAMVNVGNPHFVLFPAAEDFSSHGLPWQELGALIAVSPLFPHGTNVEFVRILSPSEFAFRIFERGCGPTQSSGTGTCASATAAMALHNTARELTAISEGGTQQVAWPSPNQPMLLTGTATILCTGESL